MLDMLHLNQQVPHYTLNGELNFELNYIKHRTASRT